MATLESVNSFLWKTLNLQSMPVFVSYLLMIILSGVWQRHSKPLVLRPELIVHNFACCIVSAVTLAGFSYALYLNGSIYGKTPSTLLENVFWLYWATKIVELGDTVFMVLRHRNRQISFLHIYHHSSMLLLSDLSRLYYPWPSIASMLAVNSLIHVILYLYYGLTALNPDNPPQWKKQVTQVQILQFILGLGIATFGYLYHGFCCWSIVYGITMISLFSNFYYHAYIRKRSKASLKSE